MLKQGNMKDRVHLHRLRQSETYGVRGFEAGIGHNLKRPEAAVVQLP